MDCQFLFNWPTNYLHIMRTFVNCIKMKLWMKSKWKFVATNDPVIWFFPTPIGAHCQTEVSGGSWSNRLRGEWYSFNYYTMKQSAWRTWMSCSYMAPTTSEATLTPAAPEMPWSGTHAICAIHHGVDCRSGGKTRQDQQFHCLLRCDLY